MLLDLYLNYKVLDLIKTKFQNIKKITNNFSILDGMKNHILEIS